MGNRYSSRWDKTYRPKLTVEACTAIDAAQHLPDAWVIASQRAWGFDDQRLSFELWHGGARPELCITTGYYHYRYVELERTVSQPSREPIARYWFLCPDCGRRCRTLFIPPGSGEIACRLCHDLCYLSQLETH